MPDDIHKKIARALLQNSIPLLGVLFFHWSVFALLLSYWLENVVIGVYQVLKMRRATLNYPVGQKNDLVVGALRPVRPEERFAYPIFFCVHYGMFLFGHLVFLRFFGLIRGEDVGFTWVIFLSALPFVFTHGKSYIETYIGEKQYEKIPLAKLFVGPYRRILVMQATIIFGSIPILFAARVFPQAAVVVVMLKVFLDVLVKEKEFAFWKKIENTV